MEERLKAAGKALHEERRSFDVSTGLRRLAHEAGYTASARPAPRQRERRSAPANGDVPPGPRAGHQLCVVARWVLNQPQAAGHVQRLAEEIGEEDTVDLKEVSVADLDVDGAQVFACMLYLAGHPESACFWWQLAAGAGHRAATYCLSLHHLEQGEVKEARQWRKQLQQDIDGPDDEFLNIVEQFAGYVRRHCTATPVPRLTEEVERLATREPDDVLVLPERELADRLQDCGNQH
ncbi:hypothetical protein AVL59_22860 [Streptomyces griseochromogenes]|uniref:Uncharacterized protein n=1 Tax=Streptomyces griseochromogenes TaxID=68214 RepID=A0A1B1BD87_9ACTN|nr:hypothetical protein [Streptomyces griseochromogenes]ANP56709.1 hypothetical protein AVL59_22860 [Streptomyces griseochromogenes]